MKRRLSLFFVLGLIMILGSSMLFAQDQIIVKIWDQFGYEGTTVLVR